jgi:hypothetical protein
LGRSRTFTRQSKGKGHFGGAFLFERQECGLLETDAAGGGMARGEKLLERMRTNPRDWRIEDVATVCAAFGIACTPPRKGSHYKVKHEGRAETLTVPRTSRSRPGMSRHW